MIRTGGGELREVAYEPSLEEVAKLAQYLAEHPDLAVLRVPAVLDLGPGREQQDVGIPVVREVLVGLAGAVQGATDAKDAGHRFWHWRNPEASRPCADCPETIAAEDAVADQAREAFVARWSGELGIELRAVEDLLAEYAGLPLRRTPRS